MDELRKLSEAACPGPWHYCMDDYDDWGMIRGAETPDEHLGSVNPPVAKTNPLWNDYDYDSHRAAGTDPMEPNGRFIVALVNAYRSGHLVEKQKT